MASSPGPDPLVASYPDVDELEAHAELVSNLALVDVVRDVVRIISVAHLMEEGFLDDKCALTGGTGLRLRGSTRFTRYDTDSSLSGRLNELELVGALRLDTDLLEVTPDEGNSWDRRKKVTHAKPIHFKAFFAAVTPDNPPSDKFQFTVSQRGLNLPPDWLPLVSPYSGLRFTKEIRVPVMHITEQAAEKAVGWAAHSLAQHYLDLAWIGANHATEIEQPKFYEQTQAKLDAGYEQYSDAYANLRTVESLFPALYAPQEWQGPLASKGDTRASQVSFMGTKTNWAQATEIVRTEIIPRLFPQKK